MKTNYHTHTYRCKHAMGNDEHIVKRAIDAGIDILGFSDHNPWPHFPVGYDSHVRMEPQYLPEYCGSVNRLRENTRIRSRFTSAWRRSTSRTICRSFLI